jgi:hypothetical protein
MPKYCAENERVKRNYVFWLEAANGKQNATIDAALEGHRSLRDINQPEALPQIPYRAGTRLPGAAHRRARRGGQALERGDRHLHAEAPP